MRYNESNMSIEAWQLIRREVAFDTQVDHSTSLAKKYLVILSQGSSEYDSDLNKKGRIVHKRKT
jgi:hypothetical protein